MSTSSTRFRRENVVKALRAVVPTPRSPEGNQICEGGAVDAWPALPYADWRDTLDTLHMYTQIVGKIRLALSPFEPQWANVPLYLTARGLTTSPVPDGLRTFDIE